MAFVEAAPLLVEKSIAAGRVHAIRIYRGREA